MATNGKFVSMWPRENPEALAAFYGRFELRSDGLPTTAWEAAHLVTTVAPYPLRAAWDPAVIITRIRCHRLVAESLKGVLRGILAHYGSVAAVRTARMDRFGGVYNYRRIAGSAQLSLHAYGAAIDLDPANNPLGRVWKLGCWMMPQAVVALFETAGWKWGGRFRSRKDCQHFQATA